jgi:hypothetical protein
MSKHEVIEQIRRLNPTASEEFLEGFPQEELIAYLHQLQEVRRERVSRSDQAAVMAG